ncbi:MAG: PorA family porin [Corynebacterium casei]|nr:porin [Corynebacterium casei]
MESFIANWATLSSDGILGTALPLLAEAGKWAGAAANLIGLVI